MITDTQQAIVIYAFNEEHTGIVFLKLYAFPEQEEEAQKDFQALTAYSEYDHYMCTQEHFAKLVESGKTNCE